MPDDSDSSRDNSAVTPMQFIKVYGLHESFIMDNAVNMFGQEINLSKTGLEQWILLSHKMKDLCKEKDKAIHIEKNNVKTMERN
jgi:hypothetical protein